MHNVDESQRRCRPQPPRWMYLCLIGRTARLFVSQLGKYNRFSTVYGSENEECAWYGNSSGNLVVISRRTMINSQLLLAGVHVAWFFLALTSDSLDPCKCTTSLVRKVNTDRGTTMTGTHNSSIRFFSGGVWRSLFLSVWVRRMIRTKKDKIPMCSKKVQVLEVMRSLLKNCSPLAAYARRTP